MDKGRNEWKYKQMLFSASYFPCFIRLSCAWVYLYLYTEFPLSPLERKMKNFQFCFSKCYFSPEKKPQWSHTSLQFQKRSQGQLCLSRCSDLLRPKSAIKSEISICRAQTFLIQFYQKQMICDIQFIAIYSYFRSTIILFECVFLKKYSESISPNSLLSSERASINFGNLEPISF